ncbi:arginase family protein [Pseudonocardia sp. ICBG1293]|uniref:arginase family protein n=1 Tax=Pseudonocardia sp. ICBG1293 TaxID=2844382 RepID=UPI001CCBE75B|nr:arginase family protein [Pseudonocardia sp. ICBG1293]
MQGELAFIGVPTSAGAHHAGQDRAPAVLRERGLLSRLRSAGVPVTDSGDVAGEVWSPDAVGAAARNIAAVVRVARRVADAVERESRAGRVPLVVGGDCTITPGVVAGLQRVNDDVRLAYVDGDADLSSPERTRSGVLDATGVAHLLGIADTELARIGARHPLLAAHQLTLLGYDATDRDSYDAAALAARPELVHADDRRLREDPDGCTARALAALRDRGGRDAAVVVHFDIDAVDSRDLPLANFPHYGTGVPAETARRVLRGLLAAPGVAAVVLTEVNPTHDPDGALLDRYVELVVGALAGRA